MLYSDSQQYYEVTHPFHDIKLNMQKYEMVN